MDDKTWQRNLEKIVGLIDQSEITIAKYTHNFHLIDEISDIEEREGDSDIRENVEEKKIGLEERLLKIDNQIIAVSKYLDFSEGYRNYRIIEYAPNLSKLVGHESRHFVIIPQNKTESSSGKTCYNISLTRRLRIPEEEMDSEVDINKPTSYTELAARSLDVSLAKVIDDTSGKITISTESEKVRFDSEFGIIKFGSRGNGSKLDAPIQDVPLSTAYTSLVNDLGEVVAEETDDLFWSLTWLRRMRDGADYDPVVYAYWPQDELSRPKEVTLEENWYCEGMLKRKQKIFMSENSNRSPNLEEMAWLRSSVAIDYLAEVIDYDTIVNAWTDYRNEPENWQGRHHMNFGAQIRNLLGYTGIDFQAREDNWFEYFKRTAVQVIRSRVNDGDDEAKEPVLRLIDPLSEDVIPTDIIKIHPEEPYSDSSDDEEVLDKIPGKDYLRPVARFDREVEAVEIRRPDLNQSEDDTPYPTTTITNEEPGEDPAMAKNYFYTLALEQARSLQEDFPELGGLVESLEKFNNTFEDEKPFQETELDFVKRSLPPQLSSVFGRIDRGAESDSIGFEMYPVENDNKSNLADRIDLHEGEEEFVNDVVDSFNIENHPAYKFIRKVSATVCLGGIPLMLYHGSKGNIDAGNTYLLASGIAGSVGAFTSIVGKGISLIYNNNLGKEEKQRKVGYMFAHTATLAALITTVIGVGQITEIIKEKLYEPQPEQTTPQTCLVEDISGKFEGLKTSNPWRADHLQNITTGNSMTIFYEFESYKMEDNDVADSRNFVQNQHAKANGWLLEGYCANGHEKSMDYASKRVHAMPEAYLNGFGASNITFVASHHEITEELLNEKDQQKAKRHVTLRPQYHECYSTPEAQIIGEGLRRLVPTERSVYLLDLSEGSEELTQILTGYNYGESNAYAYNSCIGIRPLENLRDSGNCDNSDNSNFYGAAFTTILNNDIDNLTIISNSQSKNHLNIEELTRNAQEMGVKINVIGTANYSEEEHFKLRKLAIETGGNFYIRIPSPNNE